MKTTMLLSTAGLLLLMSLGCSPPVPVDQKTDDKTGMTAEEQQEALIAPGDPVEQENTVSISQKQSAVNDQSQPGKMSLADGVPSSADVSFGAKGLQSSGLSPAEETKN